MATIERIRDYQVSSDDKFFFDNNVWMMLFSSIISGSRQHEQRIYNNLFRDIQSARATIFTNALVVSEFVNANLRIGFKRWKRLPENAGLSNYKTDFRPTQSFRDYRDIAYADLENILKVSYRKPDDFNTIELSHILGASGQTMDFNDAYFVTYCNQNRLILVTDDKDFFDTPLDVKILTC
ncbi:MAG: PIN domain-containing protein [Duncaniella sp.]|nr:PIN domain-containing protein [Duncaniella sp.]